MTDTGRGPIRVPRGTSITARNWVIAAPCPSSVRSLQAVPDRLGAPLVAGLGKELCERFQDVTIGGCRSQAALELRDRITHPTG